MEQKIGLRKEKREVAAAAAYLMGVKDRNFEDGAVYEHVDIEAVKADKGAGIVRELSILRTAIIRKYKCIDSSMLYGFQNLEQVTDEWVPQDSIKALKNLGINIVKVNYRAINYLIDINALIAKHIDACSHLFPEWAEWKYIRSIFVMPKGNTEDGIKAARQRYAANYDTLPFHCYANIPSHKFGNILYNDRKFFEAIYQFNGDYFRREDLVYEYIEPQKPQAEFNSFLKGHEKICVVVDCENSNPYLLSDALNSIYESNKTLANHIKKVILFDDSHTVNAWSVISEFIPFETERILVERINEHKSLVDQRITLKAQEEYYENGVTGFILASSDSDYWGLINCSKADFIVFAERSKTGKCFTDALESIKVDYSFIEDFATENCAFKERVIMETINSELKEKTSVSLDGLMRDIFRTLMIPVTKKEEDSIREKISRRLRIVFDDAGRMCVSCA